MAHCLSQFIKIELIYFDKLTTKLKLGYVVVEELLIYVILQFIVDIVVKEQVGYLGGKWRIIIMKGRQLTLEEVLRLDYEYVVWVDFDDKIAEERLGYHSLFRTY